MEVSGVLSLKMVIVPFMEPILTVLVHETSLRYVGESLNGDVRNGTPHNWNGDPRKLIQYAIFFYKGSLL